MEGAGGGVGGGALAVAGEEVAGLVGELAADFAAFAFDAGDAHVVVAGGLVAHPGDGGGFGPLLDGNAFGAGDGAASDGSGVGGDAGGELVGQQTVAGVEGEELIDGAFEVFDVFDLFGGAAAASGFELALVGGVGSLEGKLVAVGGDALGGGVDAAGETFAALDLDDEPVGAVRLDAAREGCIAGREEGPAGRDTEDLASGGEDVAGLGVGADFEGVFCHGGEAIEWAAGGASWYCFGAELGHVLRSMEHVFGKDFLMAQLGRVADPARFMAAIGAIDLLNDDDPKRTSLEGRPVGYELYFSVHLFRRVVELAPGASEALMLAARSQHICRWMIPREDYAMDRAGYLKWRSDLKKFHASRAASVLEAQGYDAATVERVKQLNLKQNLKTDPECQTLEDGLCLVFLEKQFAEFSAKTDEEKMVGILRKSWGKMSPAGQAAALALPMGPEQLALVQRALAGE